MKASIVVPSKGCKDIRYLLRGLRSQSCRSLEVILVLKDCDLRVVESLCQSYSLNCVIIEQKEGNVTQALNMGKKEAKGDIAIFTDDDAIPLQGWVERYVKMHYKFKDVAGISSRDIHIDLSSLQIQPIPDDNPEVRLYRLFIVSWLEQPYPLLKKYRLGVYLTKKLNIRHGFCIPNHICYSLAFRGVNMSFKTNYTYGVNFPEHRSLKRAIGFEQHFSLQLVLKGSDLIYVPNNPVFHIARSESLSRTLYKEELEKEFEIMKNLYKELLQRYGVRA
ncbi:MAG: glycosyltransferase family A protein [Thermosphaera aggregans]|jgi:glycosyltransferase involved in cell wall biosynthesis|uniref:glycosyltransferase family A protein n=1 Tax=Thermosphaera aggregans TaxID=54254 RepID=UPI003BFEE04B